MTPEEIRKIASLARLRLTDEELATSAGQFESILAHLESLRGVPTQGVEPLDHPLPLTDVLRADVPCAGLTREEALAGAPDAASAQFRVPRVMAD